MASNLGSRRRNLSPERGEARLVEISRLSAARHGWREISTRDPHLRSFVRSGEERGVERLNLYPSTGTVGTCLQHPSRAAPTQLFRRGLDVGGVEQLFANPRSHTGAGYYRRSSQTSAANVHPASHRAASDASDIPSRIPGSRNPSSRVAATPRQISRHDPDSDDGPFSDDESSRSISPSEGERLADFGGDVNLFTDYHCGLVDSDGEPTDYGREAAELEGEDHNPSDLDDHDADDSPWHQVGSCSEEEACCSERDVSDDGGNDDDCREDYSSGSGLDDFESLDDDWSDDDM